MVAICSGVPISMTLFSISVAVGQTCTQARLTRNRGLKKLVPAIPAETRLSKPALDGQGKGALHLFAGARSANRRCICRIKR